MITKQTIENIYATYHHPKYLGLDPLARVHNFKGKGSAALEIVGMIASALAYGRVEIIVRSIDTLIDGMMDGDPVAFTVNTSHKEKIKALKGFKHRFNDGDDVAGLLEGVKSIMREYGSIEGCFCGCLARAGGQTGRPFQIIPRTRAGEGRTHRSAPTTLDADARGDQHGRHQLRGALTMFTDAIRGAGGKIIDDTGGGAIFDDTGGGKIIDDTGGGAIFGGKGDRKGRPYTSALKYMLPDPRGGSACKRLLLFLRWMIRKDDGIDLGAWKSAPPRILQIPVDTHVARIAKFYGLTARNQPDWKMSEEVTAALRAFDADDPTRYDFALCHAGMVGIRG